MLLSPYLNGFADELRKLSMVGAVVGGYLGSKMPGNKLINTGAGALVGHGVGAAAKGLKRAVWDEVQERDHATLYGYMPSYSQSNQTGLFY